MKKEIFSFVVFIFLLAISAPLFATEERNLTNSNPDEISKINKIIGILWGNQQDNMSIDIKKEDFIQSEKINTYSITVRDKKSGNLLFVPNYITQIDNIFILGDIFTVDKDKVDTITWQKRNDFLVAYQKELEKKIPEKYSKIDKTKLIKIGKGSEKNEVVLFASLENLQGG